jgi:tetratricopeptide (TPR) repeat protein
LVALFVALALVGCTAQRLMDEGDAFYEQGQYAEALVKYQQAVQADPNSEEAREKVAQAKQRIVELELSAARARLSEGDLLGAAEAVRAAYDQMPEEGAVLELGSEVAGAAVRASRQFANEGDYRSGLGLLEAVYEPLEWKRVELDAPIRMIKVNWADELARLGAEAEGRGDRGDALLMYAMASRLLLRPAEVSRRNALRAQLEEEGAYAIAYTFSGDARARKIAQGVITGKPFAQNVVLVNDKAEATGILLVDVGKASFSTSRSDRTERVDYQDGVRQVENPAYASRVDEVNRRERDVLERERDVSELERDLADYQRRVDQEGDTPGTSTSAEQGVSRTLQRLEYERGQLDRERDSLMRARDQLANTPPTVDEPIMRTLEYTVTTHTRSGSMPVAVKVQHPDRRAMIKINDKVTTSTSDETHRAYPIANVTEDPLSLESDARMVGSMAQVAGQVAYEGVVRSVRSKREKILERAKAIPEASERISMYVEAILLDPTEVDEEVLVEIAELRGIDDPVSVLLAAE